MENSTTIGVDLAKNVFQVSISEEPGQVKERLRLSRSKFLSFLATRPPAEIVMEACGSAHFWARTRGISATRRPPSPTTRSSARQA
jgi:transposase